ncbi:hypothetical protein [Halosimplex marinum]|uniref:hypothetical protein n=1 Tax=Halosimplex marinum TaxID=3396620 RepID=UPI003F557364
MSDPDDVPPDPSTGNDGADDPEGDEPESETASDDRTWRRRALLLVLLLVLAFVGGGLGTLVLDLPEDVTPGVRTPSGTPEPATVSLETSENRTLLRARDVAPGDSGRSRLTLRNTGSAAGEIGVSGVVVDGSENGVVQAEAAVDDDPSESELPERLLVRLAVRYPDGEAVPVFGDGGFVPLADTEGTNRTVGRLGPGEAVTVVFEWRLPEETGNVVQSDTASFELAFGIRAPTAAETPDQ